MPSDGVKSIEFVRRKAGMPIPEFQRYWREVHGPLGASIGPVRRYVQNHTRANAYERSQPPALDGLAITWFDDTNAMRASALTDEYASTRADEPNFLTEPLDFIITDEHVLLS